MERQNSTSERSQLISKLLESRDARESYIRASLNVLIPSQIRSLRLRETWTQQDLGKASDMKQARISAIESPGAVSFSLETLIRLAAAFQVDLQVRFVPHSYKLDWENGFSQDRFTVTKLPQDHAFLDPSPPINGIQQRSVSGTEYFNNFVSAPTPPKPSPMSTITKGRSIA